MKNIKVNADKLNRDIYLLTVEEPEILNELLKDEGYNPEQLEKNGITAVKKMLFQQTVALKKAQNNNLYTKALELFEGTKETTREAILGLLIQRSPQLQFNNLDKMDEHDLKDILNETDLLDLMHKIEKGEL
ncbi:hypothetical protein [Flavobacterium hydatis]|uniref:Uncharacterized protein n=1 Tax=Flavobacterium hydatis TaxID=991 RepID=A0A086AJS7_FLAHY|nr:hypothetical protein [Flavobacterium hydatis]KFF16941.1 hypothetical protein IW20_09235 [Flavobacterium hydatis]OXA97734.1 hypothetical protein B0A62_02430 [Flavobacterium hydatis]